MFKAIVVCLRMLILCCLVFVLMNWFPMTIDQYLNLIGIYVDSNEEYQLMTRTNRLIDQNDK